MHCFSCFSRHGPDEKPALPTRQPQAASRPAAQAPELRPQPQPQPQPQTKLQPQPQANGTTHSPPRPAAPSHPGRPRPAASQQPASPRPLGNKETPAFLVVDPRAPVGQRPLARPASPAAAEPPAAALSAAELRSPPSFKGFATPKAPEPATALDGPEDSGSLKSLDRSTLGSPVSRPSSAAAQEPLPQPVRLVGRAEAEAARQRVRSAPESVAAAVGAGPDARRAPWHEQLAAVRAVSACFSRPGARRNGGPARGGSLGSGGGDGAWQAGEALYELVGVLGEGRTGVTKLMRDRRSGELVTTKWVPHMAGETLSVETEREIVNHRRLLHANVVRFREVFATDEHLVIVMDYASGGHLQEAVDVGGPLPEARARSFFRQVVDGMVYCHRQGIVHRNLRMENLLLDGHTHRPILKISGFGYSKAPDLDSAPKSINMVSPAYLPPEMLMATRNEGTSYDGRAVDVWSAGVVLFAMLTGTQPFTDDAEPGVLNRQLVQRIVHCRWELPPSVQISPECRDMLASIFVADPRRRIDSYALPSHPWLAGTLLPKAKPVAISSQTESDISLVMERARRRRAARQAAQRSSGAAAASFNEDLVDM